MKKKNIKIDNYFISQKLVFISAILGLIAMCVTNDPFETLTIYTGVVLVNVLLDYEYEDAFGQGVNDEY